MSDRSRPPSTTTRRARREAERRAARGAPAKSSAARSPIVWITAAALITGIVLIAALVLANGSSDDRRADAAERSDPDRAGRRASHRLRRRAGDARRLGRLPVPRAAASSRGRPRRGSSATTSPTASCASSSTTSPSSGRNRRTPPSRPAPRTRRASSGPITTGSSPTRAARTRAASGARSWSRIAKQVGLDVSAFEAALDDPALAAAVAAETASGAKVPVKATPTLVIGDQVIAGVPAWDSLAATIEAEIAKAVGRIDRPREGAPALGVDPGRPGHPRHRHRRLSGRHQALRRGPGLRAAAGL